MVRRRTAAASWVSYHWLWLADCCPTYRFTSSISMQLSPSTSTLRSAYQLPYLPTFIAKPPPPLPQSHLLTSQLERKVCWYRSDQRERSTLRSTRSATQDRVESCSYHPSSQHPPVSTALASQALQSHHLVVPQFQGYRIPSYAFRATPLNSPHIPSRSLLRSTTYPWTRLTSSEEVY
jgi:hypothetical protein